jgi:hypothetical protein
LTRRTFEAVAIRPDVEYIEEREPRTRPDMSRQVIQPTTAAGCLTFLGVIGSGLVAGAIIGDKAEAGVPPPAWLALFGAALLATALVALVTLRVRLEIYDDLHYTHRDLVLAEEANDEGELAFEAAPENPTVRVRGKYRWRVGEKAQMALTIYTKDGEWRGRGTLTRAMVEPWMTAYTRRYTFMVDDFRTWGWIDENNHFTDQGINKIYAWLDPPPRRNRAAGLRTGADDGHGQTRTDQGVA